MLSKTAALRPLCRRMFSTPAVTEIKTVGIVGLGLMGHGIAQVPRWCQ